MPICLIALFYNPAPSPALSRGDALPIYEYKCTTCGQSFEVVQSMSEDALARCNAAICARQDGKRKGNGRISRQLFAPAIHFKGTGFHNTDYGSRRRGGADEAGGDSGAAKSGESGASKDGDSGAPKSGESGASKDGAKDSSSSSKTVGLDKV